ncbi:CCA tRNA nucleotidyltransferase [Halalkalibacterium ligniniphilum]|uniref:CCA tRNA nucleotidyltransferase n=1 Tax=Halalkalibacterium ligniniphilum TaxID=1134413 RepID=UPI000347D786|nr:CCA tRNA nucleotidyltransferase [Halalkalibacterium ligniniphilum]
MTTYAPLLKKALSPSLFALLQILGQRGDAQKLNVFLVGGIVRDLLLGRPNEDIDVVVEGDGTAFAKELQMLFGGKVTFHPSFGTATWITAKGQKIDLVSARTESYKAPAALPTVEKSNLRADLARRDFTINTMAIQLNPSSFGQLIDYFHGKADLEKKQIRVLHHLSFIDDPTRIFRAVRFATRLMYKIEAATWKLAQEACELVKLLSNERLANELQLICSEPHVVPSFQMLDALKIWKTLIGFPFTVNNEAHLKNWLEKRPILSKDLDWFSCLAVIGYTEEAWESSLQKLAFTHQQKRFLTEVSRLKDYFKHERNLSYGELHSLCRLFKEESLQFFAAKPFEQHAALIESYVKKRNNLVPLLTGEDLKLLGFEPGPIFSEMLLSVECAMLEKMIQTKEEAINWVIHKKQKG